MLTGVNVDVDPPVNEGVPLALPAPVPRVGSIITGGTTAGIVLLGVVDCELDLEQPTLISPRAIIDVISIKVFIRPSF
jgi:hypothetical protein